jgi:general secretion pathway protein F
MPQFRYRAVTQAGELVAGQVEAPSHAEVIRRIEYLGHLPIDAQVATEGFLGGLGFSGRAPGPHDVTNFLRQLGLLVEAGLTLEAALTTLGDDTNKDVARFADNLRSSITAGHGFADALERHPTVIDPAYVAMVRAGEASGKVEGALRAIVEDRTRKELLVERVNAAIRYPLFLISSAMVILVFFLTYVVPQFASVFNDLGNRLNAGAAFVLAASTWLRANFDLVIGGCLVIILGGWVVLHKRERRGMLLDMLATIPGIAGPMRDRRTARVIGTLGLLVANGVPLPAALKILRDVVTGARALAAVDRLHDQVRSGRRFADALAETDLLPPLAVRMLRVGDETGDLPTIARHAAQFYEHRLGVGLDRLMGAVGPATIIAVSIVIGTLIISIMSALLSITELAL